MSNLFRNILNSIKLPEEDDEEYDEYLNNVEEKESERILKHPYEKSSASFYDDSDSNIKFKKQTSQNNFSNDDIKEDRKDDKRVLQPKSFSERQQSNAKLVPLRNTSTRDFEVCILKPTSFSDCQEICDMLLKGRATVINLEGFDDDLAQRIMDFVSGSVYAINGKLHPISNRIFIVSPDHVDISGDYLEMVNKHGVEAPTLKNDF